MKIHRYIIGVLAAFAIPVLGPRAGAATPEQIDKAIDKAVNYLYSVQKDDHWEFAPEFHPTAKDNGLNKLEGGDWGGLTAMATHALLAAGENANDPRLRPTIALLLKWPMRMCPYALCQRDQVLQLLHSNQATRKVAIEDGEYLANSMRTAGEAKGLYYYFPGKGGEYDHSVSQYGVLAMWACGESGYKVPDGYWETTEIAWQRHQEASGGWEYTYNPKGPGTGAMTAAGVATLFITQDYLHSMEGLECKGNITNPYIEKGMQWLGTNFNSIYATWAHIYALYGIERIGVAGGYKYFGAHDWYKEGSEWLLKYQNANGSWGDGSWLANYNVKCVPATCFALFFLTRGREPIAFNKARYDVMEKGQREEGRWNQRPRDIAKVTHWIESRTERDLNWHVVRLKETPVDDLHDSPILYLSGDRKLDLAPEDEAKLKQFVEDGGLILGNPDGVTAKAFTDSFKALGTKMFPSYEMRPLPADHPIYTREQYRGTDIHKKDTLLGLSNGVRELMLIPTYDWGRNWQANASATKQDSFELASNLYLYASGKTIFRYGGAPVDHPNPAIKTTKTIKLARLDYSGNSDPEPGGWRRIAALLHNNEKIDLDIQTVKLDAGTLTQPPAGPVVAKPTAEEIKAMAKKRITPDQIQATGLDPDKIQALVSAKVKEVEAELAAADAKRVGANSLYKLAHMTGTARFTWTDEQRAEIKKFVEGGGVLLIDAAGGARDFAAAAEKELFATFGTDATQLTGAIPGDDPLYLTGKAVEKGKPADQLKDWSYRRFVRAGEKRPLGPDLRGIKSHGRWAVLLSRQDLSNAMVGRDVDGVVGYTAESGTDLMIHLIKTLGK